MDQIIDEPTHLPTDDIQTCIDLIITSNSNAITDHGVIPSLDEKCKHQISHAQVNFHLPPPPKYKRLLWDYKACNINYLKNEIRSLEWSRLFENKNVNDMVDIFNDTLLNIAKTHIPCKLVTISDRDAPWFTKQIKYGIKKKDRIYKRWVTNGRIKSKKKVNKSQRDLNKLIKDAVAHYIDNLSKKICDPNTGSKICWSSYKRFLNNKKTTNIPPLVENGSFISNFKEKSRIFNSYFAKQCQILENTSELPNNLIFLTNNRHI